MNEDDDKVKIKTCQDYMKSIELVNKNIYVMLIKT